VESEKLKLQQEFGKLLRTVRRKRKPWSQKKLAEGLKVHKDTPGKWEKGEMLPSPQQFSEICMKLRPTPDELTSLRDAYLTCLPMELRQDFGIMSNVRGEDYQFIAEVEEIPIQNSAEAVLEKEASNVLSPTPAEEAALAPYTEVVADAARVFGWTSRDLVMAVHAARRRLQAESEDTNAAQQRRYNAVRISSERLAARTLTQYYTPASLAQHNLTTYAVRIDGLPINVPVAYKAEWAGLAIKLGGSHERRRLVKEVAQDAEVPMEMVARTFAGIAQREGKIWNDPIYRLVDVNITAQDIEVSFTLDEYLRYAFTTGMLPKELDEAIITADFNIDNVIARKRELLPLREELLPDSASLLDFQSRMCAGGVQVLFAMACPDNNFFIPLQRRSEKVADKPGLMSLIPRAMHQPMVEAAAELSLSSTTKRELYEELFGGTETERGVHQLMHDWYIRECVPLLWLHDHPESYVVECVSFGLPLTWGNYEFGILVAVFDEEFWARYGHKLALSWESKTSVVDRINVFSKDSQKVSELIKTGEWDEGSLYPFIEGLKRLSVLEPTRVRLPDIEATRL
jgi:transcriptional regulator with XRE-family HTH domain